MLYRIVYECGEQHYNAYELTYYYYSTSSFVVRLATLEALQSRLCDLLGVLYFWRRDFYVFFERLFCFYTPPHTLRAFRTAIKRIDDLAFGVFANRPWAEDWKIRFKPPQFTPSFLHYNIAETLRCSRSDSTECRRTISLAQASHFSPRHVYTLPPLSRFRRQFDLRVLPSTLSLVTGSALIPPNPNQPLY